MEMVEERKTRLEKMVATTQLMLALIKGVVNMGVLLSLKTILKRWQLCLSFPPRASVQSNVIGSVRIYIYMYIYVYKKIVIE